MQAIDPIIPRAQLLRNPDRTLFKISPDGRWLAFLGDHDGRLAIWVMPRDRSESARIVSGHAERGVTEYAWSYAADRLLYLQDDTGRERWYVNSVDVRSGEVVTLSPLVGTSARVASLSPRRPEHVLIAMNQEGAAAWDLYETDVRGGELVRTEENPGFASYIVDPDFRARIAKRVRSDGHTEFLHRDENGSWEELFLVPFEDQLTTQVEWINPERHEIFLRDSRGRNTAALVRIDLRDGSKTVLAEDEEADLGRVLIRPMDDALQAVSFDYDRVRWRFFDEGTTEVVRALSGGGKRDVDILSRSLDDRFWVAGAGDDIKPPSFHLYDCETKRGEWIANAFDAMEDAPTGHLHPLRLHARDGLELTAYLQLPHWTDPQGTGRPSEPLPLLVLVHGGPWGRDHWGFNPSTQWLANRGYATLSVNFRGSTGFGKRFVNAGNGEWGAKMQEDLYDAADWAVREGIASPSHMGIMGSSYGGYATLAALAFTPERFACGVDLSGPADLVSFLESTPTLWEPIREMLAARIGDWRTEGGRALLHARSPIHAVEEIKRPLLIVHGGNDPRVSIRESEMIAKRLEEASRTVVYVVFPDEGHTIVKPENAQAFAAIAETFLARFLGGRAEPMDEAIAHSSAVINLGSRWLKLNESNCTA